MSTELMEHRGQVSEMMAELQANRVALRRLQDRYSVFVFTGGDVPNGRYDLHAITSYLRHPFAAKSISIEKIERYRHLIEVAMGPRQDVTVGPRTLRCRAGLGDVLDRASSEITTIETALQSALASLLKEPASPLPAPPHAPYDGELHRAEKTSTVVE